MRRSHPSSVDPKGLTGLSFDVCSIASTETASTVAGRGRGGAGLRKRRGVASSAEDDDCAGERGGVMGLYSDPFSSMFSPTSSIGGGSLGSLMGPRRAGRSGGSCTSSGPMGPPDARRSHSALIGNKQNSHLRSSNCSGSGGGVQSVRVEISPTGSPVSPVPTSLTAPLAPTMNAFRRCLLMNKGCGPALSGAPLHSSDVAVSSSVVGTASSHLLPADGPSELRDAADSDDVFVAEVVEEHHIFLFDEDDADDVQSSRGRGGRHLHCGGKERRSAISRRGDGQSLLPSAPYTKHNNPHRRAGQAQGSLGAGGLTSLAQAMRRQRRVCRSRYDIEEADEDEDGCEGGAIYYVKVSHSALTPRDGPDDLVAVPQMPLLPSSVATAVVDEELAVLEELML